MLTSSKPKNFDPIALVIFSYLPLLWACGMDRDPKKMEGEVHGTEYELRTSEKIGKSLRDSLKSQLEHIQDAASLLRPRVPFMHSMLLRKGFC